MSGNITISNKTGPTAVIDIEGVIGVPESWQFDQPGDRVATYETFRQRVEAIRGVRSPQVIVNIRSTGGNVNDALLIFDALGQLRADITTRCYGYVASAATVIAQAASPGCREISANSLYLIHKSQGSADGNTNRMAQTLDMLQQTDRRIASVYAARSGRTEEQFVELMGENDGNGRWLSPEEVIGYALADRIIAGSELPEDAAQAVLNLGLPPVPTRAAHGADRRWKAILDALGIKAKTGRECHEPDNPTERASQASWRQVAELENRIAELEARNARLAARATETKPKEDPSHQEVRLSANEEAYLADARRFL